jgi:hypothetical protein
MTYKDICTKREYEKDGEKKAKWFKVGTYKKTDEGKEFIELNMFPNTPFYIFEQKKDKNESVDLNA